MSYKVKKKIGDYIYVLFVAALALISFFPIVWIFLTSFKEAREMFSTPISILPKIFSLDNYKMIFQDIRFIRYFGNTLFVTVVATAINVFISAFAAFGFSRYYLKGKKGMLLAIVVTQLFPGSVIIIPLYKFWVMLGLIDTLWALILTNAISRLPLSIWLMYGFFETVPREIDEAARVDGCSKLQTLFFILFPLSKPAILAAVIYTALNVWQEFLYSLTFTVSQEMYTLMVGLYTFIGENGVEWGALMAASIMTTVPVIAFFGMTQKQFTNGISGAVKM